MQQIRIYHALYTGHLHRCWNNLVGKNKNHWLHEAYILVKGDMAKGVDKKN